MLGLAIGDSALAPDRIVIAGLALALDIGPVGGLADEVELADADRLFLDTAIGIGDRVEAGEAGDALPFFNPPDRNLSRT